MTELCSTLYSMSLTASVAAGVVMALRWAVRRLKLPAALSVLLWLVVWVRMVLPTGVLTAPFSLLRWTAPAVETQAEAIVQVLPAAQPVPAAGTVLPAAVSPAFPWYCWLWLGGTVLLWGYGLARWMALGRRVSDALPRQEGPLVWWESDRIDTPFVYGLLRPRIFVPLGLCPEVLPWVLRHERAHIRLVHPWLKVLFFAALGLHWWNPVLWLAWVLFCRDLELQCDAAVLRRWPEQRKAYASALLALASPRLSPFSPPCFGETGVGARIRQALHWRRPGVWVLAAGLAVVPLVGAGLLCDPLFQPLPDHTPEITLHLTGDGPGMDSAHALSVSPQGEAPWPEALPALHRTDPTPSPWADLYLDGSRMPDRFSCTEYLLVDGQATEGLPAELSPYGSDAGWLLRVRPRGGETGGLETRLYVLDCTWESGGNALSLSYAFQLTFPRMAQGQAVEEPILVAGDTLLSPDGGTAAVPYGTYLNITHPNRSGEVSLTAHTDTAGETDIASGSVSGGSTGTQLTPIGAPEGTFPPQTQYYTLTYTWADGTQSIYTFTLHITP